MKRLAIAGLSWPLPAEVTDSALETALLYRPAQPHYVADPVFEGGMRDPLPRRHYSLRHSSIVRQILVGMPVRVVAALHDTSVTMIERKALLDLAAPPAGISCRYRQ